MEHIISDGFENPQVEIKSYPSIRQLDFQALHPRSVKAAYLSLLIGFMVLLLGYVIAYLLSADFRSFFWYVLLGHFVVFGLLFYFVQSRYLAKGYAIRARDISYRSGVFFKSLVVIPFSRVQHCEVDQGPIDRLFELSTLRIFTAGGASSDLSISGLEPEVANHIKDFIIRRTLDRHGEEE